MPGGFSEMSTVREASSPDGRPGLISRGLGMITSPGATFEQVVAEPRWMGILAVSVVIVAVMSTALIATEFAREQLIEQQRTSMEAFGLTVTAELDDQLAQQLDMAPYVTFGSTLVGIPILCLILAGVLYGVGSGFLGAQATFVQMLAVVAHAGVIFAVQQLFVFPLNYVRESILPPTTLAAFAPMLGNETFTYRLLSGIDLFYLWWLAALSIGLAVLWRRETRPIATTLYVVYAGIAIVFAVVRTTFGF
jgi:hypothetical protein